MKILYILPLLLICKISLAQDIPEISMKNDLVYYEFKNTLKNSSKCLSQYYQEAYHKVGTKIVSVTTANKTFHEYVYFFNTGTMLKGLMRGTKNTLTAGCADTVAMGVPLFYFIIPPAKTILSPTAQIFTHLTKAKIISHKITAQVEVIFINKNEYILKFKDFQYDVTSMKSFQPGVTEQIPLGELYQEFLNTEKKTKYQIEIFNAVNYFVNSSNEIYLKSLTELYQADEL
jgi:hypothetical protein